MKLFGKKNKEIKFEEDLENENESQLVEDEKDEVDIAPKKSFFSKFKKNKETNIDDLEENKSDESSDNKLFKEEEINPKKSLFGFFGKSKEKDIYEDVDLDEIKDPSEKSKESLFNIIEHYSSTSKDKNEEHIDSITEYNYKELLNNPVDHENFIQNVNSKFNLKYYKTLEDLTKVYDVSDYENMQTIMSEFSSSNKEENFAAMMGENTDYDLINEKIEISRKSYILPLVNRNTGKKTLGVAYPNIDILKYYMQENIVFIGIDVVNQTWGIKNVDFLKEGDDDQMAVNLVKLLTYMDTNGVSDLHLYKETETYYSLTARMGDTVLKISDDKVRVKTAEALIRAILVLGNVDTLSRQTEVKALIKKRLLNNVVRNFRISIVETSVGNSAGKSVSIRKLAGMDSLISLKALNYNATAMNIIEEIISTFKKGNGGIIVISGATNSGKTTLLYAILTLMLKRYKAESGLVKDGSATNEKKLTRIFTIENPVEITIPDLIQIDLSKTETAEAENRLTIEKAKNIILRQDPDVALVGEVRAEEEIKTVFELANTGHLAYTTIHANDCASTMKRIQNTGNIDTNTLRLLMQLIINQELVDKLCINCGGTGYIENRKKDGGKDRCPVCHKTGKEVNPGVKGRLPLYELVYFNRDRMALDDDIYNFPKLKEEGKILYISKGEVAQGYFDQGFLSKRNLDKYTGAQAQNMINDKDKNKKDDDEDLF